MGGGCSRNLRVAREACSRKLRLVSRECCSRKLRLVMESCCRRYGRMKREPGVVKVL